MTLYEISADYQSLLQMADDPDVDAEVFADTLEAIQGELEVKAEGYGVVLKELENHAEFLKAEADKLIERSKRIKLRKEQIVERMIKVFDSLELKEVNTEHFAFKVKTNPAKVVFDFPEKDLIDLIDDKFKTEKVTTTISKTLVKEAIDAGENITFAHLEKGKSLKY